MLSNDKNNMDDLIPLTHNTARSLAVERTTAKCARGKVNDGEIFRCEFAIDIHSIGETSCFVHCAQSTVAV